jgi:hypothetical protein
MTWLNNNIFRYWQISYTFFTTIKSLTLWHVEECPSGDFSEFTLFVIFKQGIFEIVWIALNNTNSAWTSYTKAGVIVFGVVRGRWSWTTGRNGIFVNGNTNSTPTTVTALTASNRIIVWIAVRITCVICAAAWIACAVWAFGVALTIASADVEFGAIWVAGTVSGASRGTGIQAVNAAWLLCAASGSGWIAIAPTKGCASRIAWSYTYTCVIIWTPYRAWRTFWMACSG